MTAFNYGSVFTGCGGKLDVVPVVTLSFDNLTPACKPRGSVVTHQAERLSIRQEQEQA